MDENEPQIGAAIRQLRKDFLGCSQSKLAEELDVSTDTVSRWERGKTEPSKLQRRFLMAIAVREDAPDELIAALHTGEGTIETKTADIATGISAGIGAAAGGVLGGPIGAIAGAVPGALAASLFQSEKSDEQLPPRIKRMKKQIRKSAARLNVGQEEFREELLSILETAAGANWEVKALIHGLYELSDTPEEDVGNSDCRPEKASAT